MFCQQKINSKNLWMFLQCLQNESLALVTMISYVYLGIRKTEKTRKGRKNEAMHGSKERKKKE
jgi:hypothetical protein